MPRQSGKARSKGQGGEGAETAQTSGGAGNADAFELLKSRHRDIESTLAKRENDDVEAPQIVREFLTLWAPYAEVEEEVLLPAAMAAAVEDKVIEAARLRRDIVALLLDEALQCGDDVGAGLIEILAKQAQDVIDASEDEVLGLFVAIQESGGADERLGEKIRDRHERATRRISSDSTPREAMRKLTPRFLSSGQRNFREHDMPRNQHMPERDQYGRFMPEDEHDRRGGYRGPERDQYGRFMSEDEHRGYGRGSSRYDNGPERDERGRFMSQDEDHRGRGYGGGGYGRGSWNDRDDQRSSSRYDDDRSGGYRSSGRYEDDRGHGGWFGDPRGHAEASRRGWEHRRDEEDGRSGYRSSSRYDDDDRRHGGWFGDSDGHSEAARRGWQHRR